MSILPVAAILSSSGLKSFMSLVSYFPQFPGFLTFACSYYDAPTTIRIPLDQIPILFAKKMKENRAKWRKLLIQCTKGSLPTDVACVLAEFYQPSWSVEVAHLEHEPDASEFESETIGDRYYPDFVALGRLGATVDYVQIDTGYDERTLLDKARGCLVDEIPEVVFLRVSDYTNNMGGHYKYLGMKWNPEGQYVLRPDQATKYLMSVVARWNDTCGLWMTGGGLKRVAGMILGSEFCLNAGLYKYKLVYDSGLTILRLSYDCIEQ